MTFDDTSFTVLLNALPEARREGGEDFESLAKQYPEKFFFELQEYETEDYEGHVVGVRFGYLFLKADHGRYETVYDQDTLDTLEEVFQQKAPNNFTDNR